MSIPLKLLLSLCFLIAPIASSSNFATPVSYAKNNPSNTGYSTLKLFLENEQHLTTVRIIKSIITFSGISDSSKKLIDDIASSSALALEKLEQLAADEPAVNFIAFSDEPIAKATFDALRKTTAKEFLFDTDNFEKNLLISQAQVLRLVSHLASELAENELNVKRRLWLEQLTQQYENHYVLVYKRIALA